MSEFSEAYYLKSNVKEDAVLLLKKAGLKGYVYPARDGWTAFVADTNPIFEFSDELKAANEGIIVQFINAEDHGWGFAIYVKNRFVCNFFCGIDEEMYEEESYKIERDKVENEFDKLLNEERDVFEVIRKYFDEDTKIENIIDNYDFTNNMKLYFSEWISYHYADLDKGEIGKYGEYEDLKLVKVDCK